MHYMNDYDLTWAWDRWAEHPLLGPAIATVRAMKAMADANSDGWAYWKAPVRAAQGLITIIQRDGTARYLRDAERADVTADEVKAAMRTVKAFRTRQMKAPHQGPGPGYWFDIYAPGPGIGGPVWVARLAYEQAIAEHNQLQLAERAGLELARRAGARLATAERRAEAATVLARLRVQLAAAQESPHGRTPVHVLERLVTLATPGTRMWVLPDYGPDGYSGYGEFGVSLGMTAPEDRGLVVIASEGDTWVGKQGAARAPYGWLRLYPSAVETVAEARERWWIVQGGSLVSGGSLDRERMVALRDEKHPGCDVVQGAEFIPADPVCCGTPRECTGRCGASYAEVGPVDTTPLRELLA